MQCPLNRHGLHPNSELAQVAGELLDADAVRAAAQTDVRGVPDTEHVSSVEGAGLLDAGHPQPEVAHGPLDPDGFAAALGGARAGEDGEVPVHDDGVLDEDRVGMVVGRFDLDDPPPGRVEGVGVRLPLLAGEVHVDGRAREVGQQPLGQARAGSADERDRRPHGIRRRHDAGHSEW